MAMEEKVLKLNDAISLMERASKDTEDSEDKLKFLGLARELKVLKDEYRNNKKLISAGITPVEKTRSMEDIPIV